MITLGTDQLDFSFPKVHAQAKLSINFQRTLRIPDDDKVYPLPPGLGSFPLRHVDDFPSRLPQSWAKRGGVMLPMHAAEALWINLKADYPCAIMVAAGKINALTGKPWAMELEDKPQNYMVSPGQPWLDGFHVSKDIIRQFIAMPLGEGYTAEEQITGIAEHGGLQILVAPMKADRYEVEFGDMEMGDFRVCHSSPIVMGQKACAPDMGLAPGGRMKQQIEKDSWGTDAWDMKNASRCYVHLTNATLWQVITGEAPPTVPPTAATYSGHGLPWFEHYADKPTLPGSEDLAKLKSVLEMGRQKNEKALPENEGVEGERVVRLGNTVRQGHW